MAGMGGGQSGLISHVFRLLDARRTKPNVVLLENVAFALSLKQGEAVTQVTNELAARGYRWAYRILNTREFGLPHRRRRIFICGMLDGDPGGALRSEEHTSELQSLMRISYAVFCLKKKNTKIV